ncbi:MAG: hypothetical protein EA396_08860 [Anaerolineaceae bacterium]|nr:MAG: hypothetical protein EA396_08860 [Anaerolineaceae bacterium]
MLKAKPSNAPSTTPQNEADDWTLDTDQMIFMMQNHNAIDAAYENDDIGYLNQMASSDQYKAIFGSMSFDEAYDRYECMI